MNASYERNRARLEGAERMGDFVRDRMRRVLASALVELRDEAVRSGFTTSLDRYCALEARKD
jgi:hypothetical protein